MKIGAALFVVYFLTHATTVTAADKRGEFIALSLGSGWHEERHGRTENGIFQSVTDSRNGVDLGLTFGYRFKNLAPVFEYRRTRLGGRGEFALEAMAIGILVHPVFHHRLFIGGGYNYGWFQLESIRHHGPQGSIEDYYTRYTRHQGYWLRTGYDVPLSNTLVIEPHFTFTNYIAGQTNGQSQYKSAVISLSLKMYGS